MLTFNPMAGTCTVEACNNTRTSISRYCSKHATNNANWGNPTKGKFNWRRSLTQQRCWLEGHILDRINEDAAYRDACEWIREYVRYYAHRPSTGSQFLLRVYQQTDPTDYYKVLAATAALTAFAIDRPFEMTAGRRYLLHLGDVVLFATTKPTHAQRSTSGNLSTALISPWRVRHKIAKDYSEQLGGVNRSLALNLLKYSPLNFK